MTDTSVTKLRLESTHKILAPEGRSVSVWEARPFQLVNLLEMLEHNANLFYFTTRNLQALQARIDKAIQARGSDALPNKAETDNTRRLIERIEREADKLNLFRILERLHNFSIHEELLQPFGGGSDFTLTHLKFQLDELHQAIAASLAHNKFVVIPADKAGYYNQPELFGSEVAARFSTANREIMEAGNCYATGNNTAGVFHLMRVVELGARVLVRRLGITKNLPYPVELCDWGTIVRELEKAVGKLPKRSSVKASETAAFYSHAVAQFLAFKDAWRNQVSHTRVSYDEYQAMSVMNNTRQFMHHLATRLRE